MCVNKNSRRFRNSILQNDFKINLDYVQQFMDTKTYNPG